MSEPDDAMDRRLRAVEDEVNRTLTVPGVDRVPVEELFPGGFMREHTRFESFREFVAEASRDPAGDEALTPVIDDFVRGTTQFGSWSEMRQKAELAWMRRTLSDGPAEGT